MEGMEVRLKVMEALQEEAYKGIVRIDSQTMRQIDVKPGSIVEIEGGRPTVGIVDRAYPTDIGQAVIRMDGILRRNAKTGIGEVVKVRKCDIKEAKLVVIAPAQKGVMVQADPDVFKRGLLGRAVVKGDIVALGGARSRRRTMAGSPFEDIFDVFEQGFMGNFGFGGLKFIVIDANPKQAVIITETTEIKVNPKAVEVTEELAPDVTYEDIGGLSEEIKKIREMVELPLKHPELFERLGIEPPKGVLLHGSPGTGKTLLAKAVANETSANFLLINGPEVTSKFYGECVTGDSLILTNGAGLITIEDAIKGKESHKIAGINMQNQKAELLQISDSYDKGLMKTRKIMTSHGFLELTPTSKLLVMGETEPEWIEVQNLKLGDKVAVTNALPEIKEEIPNIMDFVRDNVSFSGEWVKDLFNLNGKNKDVAQFLNVQPKKIEDWKYNSSSPGWVIKKLFKENFAEKLKLTGKGVIPTKFSEDLMYLLGLLAGDGHMRYNYKDDHVSTIQLTNADPVIISEFKRLVKEIFEITDIIYDDKYGYLFSSSPIGDLIRNLGIPARDKAHTITVPKYMISMPREYIAQYLKGLFDSDGYVHLVPSGMQISHYTMSKKLSIGVKYLLLRLGIQTTYRLKKDGTNELTISDKECIGRFKKFIKLNNIKRKERLETEIKTKYTKPIFNRVLLNKFVNNLIKKHKLSKNKLRNLGLNPYVNSYTRDQVKNLVTLLKELNEDQKTIEKINILVENDLIFSPINLIEESENKVYDFTVPKDHNFIANGFIVHNSEKRIREIFEEAEKNAPSIIFIDEVDAIAPKREETYGEVERRMVAQLLATMDGLKSRGKVVVIAATNRPNSLDPALRRPGRFDREIEIGVPSKLGRLNILKIHTRNMPLTKDVDLDKIAGITHGFVGADVAALCKEAAMNVLRKVLAEFDIKENDPLPPEVMDKLKVTAKDFKDALKLVRPSAMREVLIEVPNVKWNDIGGLEKLKQELKEAVEWPLKYPHAFTRLGIKPPKGILMYGPPGTGKTLLAKAVANESESNFISIKGPELISKWVGDSEKGIKKIFEKARQAAPTIIFFDEIDSIASKRGMDLGAKVTERMVNQLLTEMDGLEELTDVVVIAATNRPDMIDTALLRPGRFDRIISTTVPDKEARLEIFKIHTTNMPLAKDVDIKKLAEKTENYAGADIEGVCREAGLLTLRENIKATEIPMKYFLEALDKVKPSIRAEDLKRYQEIEEEYLRTARAAISEKPPSYLG